MAAGASSSPGIGRRGTGIGPGRVVLVVGPSGAGKDTLLRLVRTHLGGDERYFFPRRVVTRLADAWEDHTTLSSEGFLERIERGGFALHWEAHGRRYGIPAEADTAVLAGRTVVFNASRLILPVARRRYAAVACIVVDVPVEVRAARLALRDRETPEEALARLQRVVSGFHVTASDLFVDNSGPPEHAAQLIVGWLQARTLG